MAEKITGIDALKKAISDAWDDVKDSAKEDYLSNSDYDYSEISDLAHETSEALSVSENTDRTGILIDLQNGEHEISDLELLDVAGKQPHQIINDLINTVIYDRAQEIFHEKFEEARKDWDKELESGSPKGPGE